MAEDASGKKPGDDDFDTTAELWDRVVEDILARGAPCLETVEKLVDEACQRPARPKKPSPDK